MVFTFTTGTLSLPPHFHIALAVPVEAQRAAPATPRVPITLRRLIKGSEAVVVKIREEDEAEGSWEWGMESDVGN
jgi:hypothetical protein